MVFLSSQNLIQSEAVLRPRAVLPETKPKAGGIAAIRRQNGKAAPAKANDKASANGSSVVSSAEKSTQPSAGDDTAAEIDFTQLPCGYHTAVVAGLALSRALSSCGDGVVRHHNINQQLRTAYRAWQSCCREDWPVHRPL